MTRPLAMAKAHDYPHAKQAIERAPRGPQPQRLTTTQRYWYRRFTSWGFDSLQALALSTGGWGFTTLPERVER